ncbi:unnamed protein product [Toxocara canis]|uniref:diacylglycerol O-acyltransferase n=1 Tax=Toxocara canis TaxID=6265 RepID=A0A183UHA9_TOXCA|nr:unnamed protein product [Toxocara canis]
MFKLEFLVFSIFSFFYALWFCYDYYTPERGSRPNRWARKWKIYEYVANYFPIKLHKTSNLSPQHNYIIGAHPHGILAFGSFISLCTDATGFDRLFPEIHPTIATLKGAFWFPLRREQLLYMTGMIAVNSESILYYLNQSTKGRAVAIVVGGAEELLEAHAYTHRVCLANRKGFIRLAIQSGAYLVPMYSFGENDVYYQIPNEKGSFVRGIQGLLKRIFTYSPTIVLGRGIFNRFIGFMPHRRPIHCVVGEPIVVHKKSNPTQKEVDELHALYCRQLNSLFEANKLKFGVSHSAHLQFV